MLESTKLIITQHARERFTNRGGTGDIGKQIRSARLANKTEKLLISQSCRKNSNKVVDSKHVYYVSNDGFVFVTTSRSPGFIEVITCWKLKGR